MKLDFRLLLGRSEQLSFPLKANRIFQVTGSGQVDMNP